MPLFDIYLLLIGNYVYFVEYLWVLSTIFLCTFNFLGSYEKQNWDK